MNNKGQLLTYDIILSLVLVMIILLSVTFILEQSDDVILKDYKKPVDYLNILEDTKIGDESVLISLLSNNTKKDSIEIINNILPEYYLIKDNTHEIILINKSTIHYNQIQTSKKSIDGIIFELWLYY